MIVRLEAKGNRVFVIVFLSFGSITVSRSSLQAHAALPIHACPSGFVQRSRIVLDCNGGNQKMNFELAGIDRPHHLMFWQAPSGTQHLSATAVLYPTHGGEGRASLRVVCVDTEKVLIDDESGLLNHNRRHAKIEGSHWQWGSDLKSDYGERFELWFRVDGSLPCDIVVVLRNDASTHLSGSFQYEWKTILNCPDAPLGCKRCSEEEAGCMDMGLIAVCDGSPNVTCKTAAEVKTKPTAESSLVTTSNAYHVNSAGGDLIVRRPGSSSPLLHENNTNPKSAVMSGILFCIPVGIIFFCIFMFVRRSRQTAVLTLPRHEEALDFLQVQSEHDNDASLMSGVDKSSGIEGDGPVDTDFLASNKDPSPAGRAPWGNDGL